MKRRTFLGATLAFLSAPAIVLQWQPERRDVYSPELMEAGNSFDAPNPISDAFVQQYTDCVIRLAEQKESRLRSAVRGATISGEESFFDQIGA